MSFETIWVRVRADMADFNSKMNSMKSQLTQVGNRMKSAGQSMTLGLTVPIALFGASMLKAAGNFEAGMNRVQALTGATQKQFKDLNDLAKELGATTQFSASEAADAMGFLGMAGMDALKIYGAMPDTLNLAAAAQIDMGSAADIVTNVLTGMQVPMEELPKAVDIMTKAFTSSNTDLLQLGQAMKFVGPVAGSFGIELSEVTAALGLMGNAGLQASMAGTGFRKILTTLVARSDKLGVTVLKANGKMRPFADILEELEKNGFDAGDALKYFGDRGGPALITLMGAGAAKIREFSQTLEGAGGTAKTIADVQMKGLNGAIKAVKSAFEAFNLAIADSGLLSWVTDFAKGLADFFREAAKANPAMLRMAVAFAAVLAVAGPLLLIMGSLITAVGALLGPITLIVAALGFLAAGYASSVLGSQNLTGQLERQQIEVNELVSHLRGLNLSEEKRAKLITRLNELAPDLVKTLNDEGVATTRTVSALRNLNREYAKKIVLAVKDDEIQKVRRAEGQRALLLFKREQRVQKLINKIREEGNTLQKTQIENAEAAGVANKDLALSLIEQGDASKGTIKTLQAQVTWLVAEEAALKNAEKATDEMTEANNEMARSIASISGGGGSEEGSGGSEDSPVKAMAADFVSAKDKAVGFQNQMNALRNLMDEKMPDPLEVWGEETLAAKTQAGEDFIITMEEHMDRLRAMAEGAASWMTSLSDGISNAFARAISATVQGGNGLQVLLAGLLNSFGQFLIEFGKAGIAYGILVKAVKNAWAAPILAIGLSIAAIAAGGVLKGLAGKVMSAPKLAKGGIVRSPTMAMIGDNPNAMTDPEVVAPLSKLQGLLSNGGGSQELFAVISGEDLYLSNQEYLRRLENTNG